MRQKLWFKAIRYYWQFQPFHLSFILLMVLYAIIRYFTLNVQVDTSSFIGLILLMTKIVFVFALVIILFGLLSTLICFGWFWYRKTKQKPAITLELDAEQQKQGDVVIRTVLPFALRPFLGYVNVRLQYDQGDLSSKFRMERKRKGQWFFFQPGLESTNRLHLDDIKEYRFQRAIIYFEDFLRLFSLAIPVSVFDHIKNIPRIQQELNTPIQPKKTEEEKVRIQQLRKVEGEYLNYKKFENSDDVRRIVWKIFAKNKELVVRIPEIMDPFSSHIYFYPSYFNSENNLAYAPYHQAMLNFYKHWVYTLYHALTEQQFEVQYIADQLIRDTQRNTEYTITLSEWHQDKVLSNFVKPQHASVICIHSFSDIKDLEKLLPSLDAQTKIYFVRLSASMRSLYLFHWMYRLFFLPAKDELAKLKNRWPLHPLKFKTYQREKKILNLLKQSDCNFEMLP